ncbi:uncharacterized protein MYCFIDRAFT_77298 [Pseudocercospora fijiensis CIRAD86]|uniref:Uncharacterized protein n=1 Tax=Pseudocercospora fijiensis (strain CIRAD86) TaxID=383855 RepID=M3AQL6_PSEFD|nr:uncharacterized protein MYCFIDRAFT_77298 [Pseudocercospora fijiensis CIRAD86]EME86906.1 hypothetical protein MYCFIDRAFT_77298 [Pseudocercospora fijiensis CIRAD86]
MANVPYEMDFGGTKRTRTDPEDFQFLRASKQFKRDWSEQSDIEEVGSTTRSFDTGSRAAEKIRTPTSGPKQQSKQNEKNLTTAGFFSWPINKTCEMISGRSSHKALHDKRHEQNEAKIADLEAQIEELRGKLKSAKQSAEQRRKNYEDERSRRISETNKQNDLVQQQHNSYERLAKEMKQKAAEKEKADQRVAAVQREANERIKEADCDAVKAREQSIHWEHTVDELKLKIEALERSTIAQHHSMKQLEGFKKDAERAQNQKLAAEKARREQEQKVDGLEKTIRSLQSRALRSVEPEKWAPLSSSDIEHELKGVLSSVRQWAQTHCHLTFDDVIDNFKLLGEVLDDQGCISGRKQLWDALVGNAAIQKHQKAASLIFTALASNHICKKIIGDPFFAFVEVQQKANALYHGDGAAVRALVDMIRQSDERGAEAWRCQLLRLLDPATVEENRKSAAASLCHEFFYKVLRLDPKVDYSAEYNELLEIMKQATDLAWRLWTRKTRVEVRDCADMMRQLGRNQALFYTSRNKQFEAHPLHNLDLDDDPTAKDQAEIVLLSSPLIVISGNSDGDDYKKQTILKRAVVWMG